MPLRLLALGDSYTIGEGVTLAEGWPAQLAEMLNQAGLSFAPSQIIAKTGWTTDELIAGISQAEIDPPYELVTLLIGVNNQYRKLALAQYIKEFATLLDQAVAFAGNKPERVIVLSIPDWSVTPYFQEQDTHDSRTQVASQLDAYNVENCRQAYKRGVTYVDITGITREHKHDVHAWTDDGLHPAELMYTQWARKLEPVAIRLLGKTG